MTDEPSKPVPPKGGRKGGAKFPRFTLEDSLKWAKKLVSKTHSAPQPVDVIYSAVVGAKGGRGDVKISALRQYGLLQGDAKGYDATELAKQINAAPIEELTPLLRAAALNPTIFRGLFETFHGDSFPRSKIKQRAADLNVHPDESENCAEIYLAAMSTAGIVSTDGEQIIHISSADVSTPAQSDGFDDPAGVSEGAYSSEKVDGDKVEAAFADEQVVGGRTHRAVVNVNLTVDSTMDVEKLERQLRLLKQFGAL